MRIRCSCAEELQQLTADRGIPIVALVPADDSASALHAVFPFTMIKPASPADFPQVLDEAHATESSLAGDDRSRTCRPAPTAEDHVGR